MENILHIQTGGGEQEFCHKVGLYFIQNDGEGTRNIIFLFTSGTLKQNGSYP